MLPRVKTISCGGTSRIRTQHASKNSTSPVVIATLRFYRLFAYSTAETRQCAVFSLLLFTLENPHERPLEFRFLLFTQCPLYKLLVGHQVVLWDL